MPTYVRSCCAALVASQWLSTSAVVRTHTHTPPNHDVSLQVLVLVGQRRGLRVGELRLVLRDRRLVDEHLQCARARHAMTAAWHEGSASAHSKSRGMAA
eukprot:2102081-Prymnesium_polylepis.1